MRQHRAFGDARGAAGILQEGDIVGLDRGGREPDLRPAASASLNGDRAGHCVSRHHFLDVANDDIDQRAFHATEHVAHAGDHDVFDLACCGSACCSTAAKFSSTMMASAPASVSWNSSSRGL